MTARLNNIVFTPDPLPEKVNGVLIQSSNPNHRTGTVISVGDQVKCNEPKPGKHFLYLQRNCVQCEGHHIVNEDNVVFQVASDVILGYEEVTPENKIKVNLVNK